MNTCTAFSGAKRIASGELPKVAFKTKALWDRDRWAQILIFDDVTSQPIEIDFRGTPQEVLQRIAARPATQEPSAAQTGERRAGRPKLGVVAREVTLLPRHWDWLATQPGGASVALRKLVEHARTANQSIDRRRRAQESAYRFLSAMAGNEPGFEEALRALFANKPKAFDQHSAAWPKDIRGHARKLALAAFTE